jgi:hypothetical protein
VGERGERAIAVIDDIFNRSDGFGLIRFFNFH